MPEQENVLRPGDVEILDRHRVVVFGDQPQDGIAYDGDHRPDCDRGRKANEEAARCNRDDEERHRSRALKGRAGVQLQQLAVERNIPRLLRERIADTADSLGHIGVAMWLRSDPQCSCLR